MTKYHRQPDPARTLAAALAAADQGLAVAPVLRFYATDGKPGWSQTGDEPSTDAAAIRAMLEEHPGHAPGIYLEPSELVVVDIDPKDSGWESWQELQTSRGWSLGETVKVLTPSEGMHAYYRRGPIPDDLLPHLKNVIKVRPGVDLLATGFVPVAGTGREDGVYRDAPMEGLGQAEIAPAPDWLMQAVIAAARDNRDRKQKTVEVDATPLPPDLPESLVGILEDPASVSDRSRRFSHLVRTAAAEGFTPGQTLELVRHHRPSMAKYGPRGEGAIAKLVTDEMSRAAADAEALSLQVDIAPTSRPEITTTVEQAVTLRAGNLTDKTNAVLLHAMRGAELRYISAWGKFIAWDGRRYEVDHSSVLVSRFAMEVGRVWFDAISRAPEEDRKAFFRHAQYSESARGVNAMTALLRSIPGIAVDHEDLDADAWLLNLDNGVLDLRERQLVPHSSDRLITKLAPTRYDDGADPREWLGFLERVQPDPEVRRFLQEFAGYCLTGVTREHLLPINLGVGANGKTTYTEAVSATLGEYAATFDLDLLLGSGGHPTVFTTLFGVRFAYASESRRFQHLEEATVKRLTGGDRISARRMREDFWEFSPSHKLWVATNHRPQIVGGGDAIWRRLRLIPWDVVIPADEQDRALLERLQSDENRAAILAWAVEGLGRYLEHGGFTDLPEQVQAATDTYRADEDTVAQFISETGLVFGNSAFRIQASKLKELHESWFESMGLDRPEKGHYQLVLDALKAKGVTRSKRQRIDDGRDYWWQGVGLAAGDDQ